MAIPYFYHGTYNKKTQVRPYMVAEHAEYILRLSAATVIGSYNAPLNYHAILDFLKTTENGMRKNGRWDKFRIAIPREVDLQQAEQVIRKFGRRIGKGEAPFIFAIHWEENNPHAHCIFLDRGKDGKRVFGTSELGSTHKLKLEWQTEANDFMQGLGIDARIDFAEAERKVANDNKLEQDNAPPVEEVEPDPVDVPREAEPVEAEPEADEMAVIEYPQAEETISRDEWLANVRSTVNEMHVLDRKRRDYTTAETQYKHWRTEAVKAREEASRAEAAYFAADKAQYVAEQEHKRTHILGVKLGVKLFGWKSQGYKNAEEAEKKLTHAEYNLGLTAENRREAEAYRNMATAKVHEYEDKLMGEERQLARIDKVYGKQMLFDEAEGELKNTFAHLTKDITPEHVLAMHDSKEISWAEAREYLHFMGHDDVIAEVERDQGQEQ